MGGKSRKTGHISKKLIDRIKNSKNLKRNKKPVDIKENEMELFKDFEDEK